MRLLIAEDDAVLADGLVRSLRKVGYTVDCVHCGATADSALATGEFDLLILDLGLPRMSGLDVLRRMRTRGTTTPVLILSALDSVHDRVRGLDLGADDYLAKPFALAELEARVRALARRGQGAVGGLVKHGALVYDTVGKTAEAHGQMLELSARESTLLEIFLQRTGRMVSKEQMVDFLCEWGEEVSTNAIEVYVHRLRRKVEVAGLRIVTVRGLGYCLQKPTAAETAAAARSRDDRTDDRGDDRASTNDGARGNASRY
jgi:two-component system, OmpR family, response regulator